jgi:ADP-ribosyl-[dinitrogen reductase] hydrolase
MTKIPNESWLREKIRGCLLGVAIGNALGAPFEHLLPGETNQMLERCGGRITDFHPYWRYPAGTWTDDTGMTLASVRALIEMEKAGSPLDEAFQTAFCDWACSLECLKPGGTVLYAARYATADLNSWSNGALMRIAPAGIYANLKGLDTVQSAEIAYRLARMTHFRPLAVFPAVSAALAIRSILFDEPNVPHLPAAHALCRGYIATDRQGAALRYEQDYLDRYAGPISELPATTGLWMWRHVMERCLEILPEYGARNGDEFRAWNMLPSFEEGILETVNSSFDRDTAGAVAGAILGAYWGETQIPERWRNGVHKSAEIIQLADDLIQACRHSETKPDRDCESKQS